MVIEKTIITPTWLKIKEKFKTETNGNTEYGQNFERHGELDDMCDDFIDMLLDLTEEFGFDTIIEDVPLDLHKERVYNLLDKAGLMAPYIDYEGGDDE